MKIFVDADEAEELIDLACAGASFDIKDNPKNVEPAKDGDVPAIDAVLSPQCKESRSGRLI